MLHDFFEKRADQLVTKKYLHLLRWARFCVATPVIERMREEFDTHLKHIKEEYEDAQKRAARLKASVDSMLVEESRESMGGDLGAAGELAESSLEADAECNAGAAQHQEHRKSTYLSKDQLMPQEVRNQPMQAVDVEDLRIYCRWLIHLQQSAAPLDRFFRTLQWMPSSHRVAIRPQVTKQSTGISVASLLGTDEAAPPPRRGRRFSVRDARLPTIDKDHVGEHVPHGESLDEDGRPQHHSTWHALHATVTLEDDAQSLFSNGASDVNPSVARGRRATLGPGHRDEIPKHLLHSNVGAGSSASVLSNAGSQSSGRGGRLSSPVQRKPMGAIDEVSLLSAAVATILLPSFRCLLVTRPTANARALVDFLCSLFFPSFHAIGSLGQGCR